MNTLLGGGTGPVTIAAASDLTGSLNSAFDEGSVSAFAQDHIVNGGCP